MQISCVRQSPQAARRPNSACFSLLTSLLAGLLTGCASPSPPLPPSLNLPDVVQNLSATRAGEAVTLRWTTPSRTTDKLFVHGGLNVEICRQTAVPAAQTAGLPCTVVATRQVDPGESEAVDHLPGSLAQGTARALEYRVQLVNAAGRSAGWSAPARSVAGTAPAPLAGFRGAGTKRGVVLEWDTDPNGGGGETIELQRTWLDPPDPGKPPTTPGVGREPLELRFRAGAAGGPGGTTDRTAQIGRTYRYTAQRVRTVDVGGHTLELRSPFAAAVTVAVRDVFPPDPPAGLVAVPGFTGEGETLRPAIDLSWEPDMEPRLAGYRVYRRGLEGPGAGWQPLGSEVVRVAAYHDAAVAAGAGYSYRVTAVNEAGIESAPGAEVSESAPAPAP